ncbi:MAG: hypothetical protein EAZ34_02795 [Polaromonas sp.]|nr:MAG: hypothetical protein EAZ34_02795 [Polaromonas sp.]
MLDKRQRAMLREIGVHVWQPLAPEPAAWVAPPLKPALKSADSALAPAPLEAKNAIDSVAGGAGLTGARGTFRPQFRPQTVPVQPPAPPQASARNDTHNDIHRDSSTASWSAGQALALYAPLPGQPRPSPGPRWLVLAETPAAALQAQALDPSALFNPFDGEAGRLLDNMLRAVKLHQTGSVVLAPLVRRMGHEAAHHCANSDFHATLASLVQTVQPDVVLVMGRLAAQAVLQSSTPFGKLRGQVHSLHGSPAIATIDATYLLRSPLEKARAWEDLCRALSVLQPD